MLLVMPVQDKRHRGRQRVGNLQHITFGTIGIVHHILGHARFEDKLSTILPHGGLYVVVVGGTGLGRAVGESHGHGLSQVLAPLCSEHGEAEGHVLLAVILKTTPHRPLTFGLTVLRLAIEHTHRHQCQGVVLGVAGLELLQRQWLQGIGQRVDLKSMVAVALGNAQHIDARRCQILP